MIRVKKLNNQEMVINADLIETVEATPDTIVSLTTGKKFMVQDTVEAIIAKVIDYRRLYMSLRNKVE